MKYEKADANVIDAIANGTIVGLRLAINIGVVLIKFYGVVVSC